MTKAFMGFLVAALVLGVALGAAFAGGVAFGKSQGDDTGQPQAFGRFQQGEGAQPGGQFNRPGQGQPPAGVRPEGSSGRATGQGSSNGPADMPPTGEQRDGRNDGPAFQRGERQGAGVGRPGSPSVFGTIQSVEGTQLTVETRQGATNVSVGPDTRVYRLVEASTDDLQPQAQVRATGPRSDEGLVEAASVVIVPEGGQDALFPGGGRRPSP